jgi:membrane protein required for colicin V production
MNWLDLLLVAVFGISIAAGAIKGFARIAIGLAAAILGVIFASIWYAQAGTLVADYVASRTVANAAGFLLILAATIAAGALLSWILAAVFKWAGVQWVDRLLGATFGFLRALVICAAIVWVMMAFPRATLPRAVASSVIAPYVMRGAQVLALLAPREVQAVFEANYSEVRKLRSARRQPGEPGFQ